MMLRIWPAAPTAIVLLGLVLLLGCGLPPLPASAPLAQPTKVYRIGWLGTAPGNPTYEGVRQGLRDLGYIEGQTIVFEPRFSSGEDARLPELATELIELRPDVIVSEGATAHHAAQATRTIPIVFPGHSLPVELGLVESLAHPGRNVTGVLGNPPEILGKQFQFLKEVVPQASRVAVLMQARLPDREGRIQVLDAVAPRFGIEPLLLEISPNDDLDATFAAIDRARAEGIAVLSTGLMTQLAPRIAELALQHQLPIIGGQGAAAAGALMGYGDNNDARWHRAAVLVDKILKGAKPADLPVEAPTHYDFVINLKTAQALGITVPQSVLLQATEVIQ